MALAQSIGFGTIYWLWHNLLAMALSIGLGTIAQLIELFLIKTRYLSAVDRIFRILAVMARCLIIGN